MGCNILDSMIGELVVMMLLINIGATDIIHVRSLMGVPLVLILNPSIVDSIVDLNMIVTIH
jgi:hypothetical protein